MHGTEQTQDTQQSKNLVGMVREIIPCIEDYDNAVAKQCNGARFDKRYQPHIKEGKFTGMSVRYYNGAGAHLGSFNFWFDREMKEPGPKPFVKTTFRCVPYTDGQFGYPISRN